MDKENIYKSRTEHEATFSILRLFVRIIASNMLQFPGSTSFTKCEGLFLLMRIDVIGFSNSYIIAGFAKGSRE